MGSGRGKMESVRRATRTVLFMVMMVGSLVTSSASVIVAMADVIMPCVILSIFTCCHSCYTLTFEWNTYSFRSSLADIPLLSLFRSFLILCAYYVCDVHCLSNGPYLGITVICALASAAILIIKVSFFTFLEAVRASPTAPRSPRFKQSWGMPAMFLSSMVLALGHIVVAYRIRYQSRRMLLLQRVDPEAVLVSKAASHGYQKILRSPNLRKLGRVDSEGKMHSFYAERDIPAKMLADEDSLFILCEGLVIHYKIIYERPIFGSMIHNSFGDANDRDWCITPARPTFDNPSKVVSVCRSLSHSITNTSLHTPLMDSFTEEGTSTSSCGFDECFSFPQQIPRQKLENYMHYEMDAKAELSNPGSLVTKTGQQKTGLDGIILIHGFGGGAFAWRNVMTPLARHTGCPVVAFDRPGWGLTSRPQRAEWEEKRLPNPYELRSQVDSLFSFCKKLGLFSVVLVGHDDGGLLSLMAAEKAQTCVDASPVQVKGVVLVSMSISREVIPTFARVLLHTSLGRHLVRPLLRTEIIQVANRRSWHDASKLTADVLDLYKAPLRVEGWDNAIAEVSKLSIGTMLSSSHASDLLKAVQGLPVLITVGAEDILVSLQSSQFLASKISNSRLVAISGCGHLPHEECPKELLAAIVPFVSNLCMELNLSDKFLSDGYR